MYSFDLHKTEGQYLARDALEERILGTLTQVFPRGLMAPQIAQAVGAHVQTCRYRLFQLLAAGVIRGEWHRRFLFYYVKDRHAEVEKR